MSNIYPVLSSLKFRNGTLLYLRSADHDRYYIRDYVLGGGEGLRGYKKALDIHVRCSTTPEGEYWFTDGSFETLEPNTEGTHSFYINSTSHILAKGTPFHFRTECKRDKKDKNKYIKMPLKWYLLPGWGYKEIRVIEGCKDRERPVRFPSGLISDAVIWKEVEDEMLGIKATPMLRSGGIALANLY